MVGCRLFLFHRVLSSCFPSSAHLHHLNLLPGQRASRQPSTQDQTTEQRRYFVTVWIINTTTHRKNIRSRGPTEVFYIYYSGAVVAEGGKVMIDRSKLDASNLLEQITEPKRKDHHILYRVISPPRHGALSVRGYNLTRCIFQFAEITLLPSSKPA